MIKVLMISTDAKIFEEGSGVRERMRQYGQLFEELHIIVLVGKAYGCNPFSIDNVHIYPTNSLTKLLYVSNAINLGSLIIKKSNLTQGQCVITAQDPFETGYAARMLSERFSIPLHIQVHTDFLNPYFSKQGGLNIIRTALAEKNLRAASAIRVVSERIRESIAGDESLGVDAAYISVLPIFTDLQGIRDVTVPIGFSQRYLGSDKIALMASRFTKEKDIETAIEAFARVVMAFPKALLVIIGAGPEEAGLHEKVKKLGIEENVMIESWANRETLVSYMKTVDVFISSSLYEGYGLSMLEAYVAGAQVVATDAGIAHDLTDAICPPKSPDCLAAKIISVFLGEKVSREFKYEYKSKEAYMEAYRRDIERALS
jgi:glycosyltransferase involved in cell wall biosynthesis